MSWRSAAFLLRDPIFGERVDDDPIEGITDHRDSRRLLGIYLGVLPRLWLQRPVVWACTHHRVVAHRASFEGADTGLDLLQRFLGYLRALDGEGVDAVEVLVIAEATNGIVLDDARFAELLMRWIASRSPWDCSPRVELLR